MKTKSVWSNCVVSAAYLCLRGNVKNVYFVKTMHPVVIAHIVIENKQGNIVHFLPLWLKKEGEHQNPLYFNGHFEGIKRSEIPTLKEERPFFFKMNPCWYLLFFVLIMILLFIPWIIFWPFQFVFLRIIPDTFKVLKNHATLLFRK